MGAGMREDAAKIELEVIRFLEQNIHFDLQSGHTELGISKMQAALEFTILQPYLSNAVPGPGLLLHERAQCCNCR